MVSQYVKWTGRKWTGYLRLISTIDSVGFSWNQLYYTSIFYLQIWKPQYLYYAITYVYKPIFSHIQYSVKYVYKMTM